MTYEARDTSVTDGAPLECYEFRAAHKTWRYTSNPDPITIDGEVYEPLVIVRTAFDITSIVDSNITMDFILPADNELAETFCYMVTPKGLEVTVRRMHLGDDYGTENRVEWEGEIAGSSANEAYATIKTVSKLQARLAGNLSAIYYQKVCNHTLFDERCKVVRADFTETATVTLVQSQLITVDDMVWPENEMVGGMMTNTRTGEQQSVISNVNDVIRLGYPFFDIVAGDTVELTLGCDHLRLGDCKERFANVANYGGHDFIPDNNPFGQLNYQTITNTTIEQRKQKLGAMLSPSSSTT